MATAEAFTFILQNLTNFASNATSYGLISGAADNSEQISKYFLARQFYVSANAKYSGGVDISESTTAFFNNSSAPTDAPIPPLSRGTVYGSYLGYGVYLNNDADSEFGLTVLLKLAIYGQGQTKFLPYFDFINTGTPVIVATRGNPAEYWGPLGYSFVSIGSTHILGCTMTVYGNASLTVTSYTINVDDTIADAYYDQFSYQGLSS